MAKQIKKIVVDEVKKDEKTPIGYTWVDGVKTPFYDEVEVARNGIYVKWELKEDKTEAEYDIVKKGLVFAKRELHEDDKGYESRLKAHRVALAKLNSEYYDKVTIDPHSKKEVEKKDPRAISHYVYSEDGERIAICNDGKKK